MDLRDAIVEFAVPGVERLRRELGIDIAGRVVEAAPETQPITASVQPTDPETIALLPEGLRARKAITVVTETELRTAGADHPADQVSYGGELFDVHLVKDWEALGRFYRAVCVRAR